MSLPSRVGVLGSKHGSNFKYPLHVPGDSHLLVQLRRLRETSLLRCYEAIGDKEVENGHLTGCNSGRERKNRRQLW